MAITNGYTTLAQVQYRLNPAGLTGQTTDDAVIERMVEGVSRWIDNLTRRTFYARTETHYYDCPQSGLALFINDDTLLSISTLTNGDGTVITSGQYKLYPLNTTQKYEIVLLPSAGITWTLSTADDVEAAISVAGTWGWTSSAPHDIREACEEIVVIAFKNRTGLGDSAAHLSAFGAIMPDAKIPDIAAAILAAYPPVMT